MLIVVKTGGEAAMPAWRAAFAEHDPHVTLAWWDDPALDPARVDHALVWDPDPGRLAAMPNLKLIFGSGAGVDGILADPLLPPHVPLIRMATPDAAQRMGEYVCWAALSLLRGARRMAIAQARGTWDYFDVEPSGATTRVGIMGLGVMGARAAEMLLGLGFRVQGWSRSRKRIAGVASFAGEAERDAFLGSTDILVCLLPATPETRGVIAAPLLGLLPHGACLVNAGRGHHQVLPDILAALDTGQLSGAVLDVFEEEPLPDGHPAWSHPRLTITPHCASLPPRSARARFVVETIRAFERGEALPPALIADRARGY
jgi:glyoxylate/hydroxypyruvate reductase